MAFLPEVQYVGLGSLLGVPYKGLGSLFGVPYKGLGSLPEVPYMALSLSSSWWVESSRKVRNS